MASRADSRLPLEDHLLIVMLVLVTAHHPAASTWDEVLLLFHQHLPAYQQGRLKFKVGIPTRQTFTQQASAHLRVLRRDFLLLHLLGFLFLLLDHQIPPLCRQASCHHRASNRLQDFLVGEGHYSPHLTLASPSRGVSSNTDGVYEIIHAISGGEKRRHINMKPDLE